MERIWREKGLQVPQLVAGASAGRVVHAFKRATEESCLGL